MELLNLHLQFIENAGILSNGYEQGYTLLGYCLRADPRFES